MIQLKNVHKAFGPKRVLDGFTLDVPEGETMVIIGYSGTGKSVAIKHIVGLLEPDEGEVWVDGLNVPELSRRELYALRARLGSVFQFDFAVIMVILVSGLGVMAWARFRKFPPLFEAYEHQLARQRYLARARSSRPEATIRTKGGRAKQQRKRR